MAEDKNNVKRQRFQKVAAKRVQKILDGMDTLGKCSNKINYEYNEEEVEKMFSAIREKTKEVENLYYEKVKKGQDNFFQF